MGLVLHRFGKSVLKKMPVASATVIARGDMLYFDTTSHVVKPASDFTWDTDLATTQGAFAAVFCGIAEEASASGETTPISVETSPEAVYEIDVPSGTYHQDDKFGPDKDTGNALLDQTVESAIAAASICRCFKDMTAAGTRVYVTFAPALSTNSSNVNANIG